MGTWNTPVATIINRLKDILVYSDTGNNVENLPLDLINRAQMYLSTYRQWDYLKKVVALTLGDNRIATLPSDINAILDIYVDQGIGKPSIHYYQNGNDVEERYELFDNFSATTGHSWYIQFPSTASLPGQLYLIYTYNLADITADDLFTFFPAEVLLRCAQVLHHEDKGITGDSSQLAINAFEKNLANFIRNSQYTNQQMDLSITNAYGDPVKIAGHSIDGRTTKHRSPYTNSTILVR